MNTSWIAQAAWSPNDGDTRTFFMIVIGLGIPAVLLIGGLVYRDWRRNMKIREQNIKALQDHRERERVTEETRNEQDRAHREREDKAYHQHVNLNELTAEKFQAETKVLEAQLAAMERDRAARERDEEYHKLMVQKARLEIQSLQLHIREQRKRIDDFTSYDDE